MQLHSLPSEVLHRIGDLFEPGDLDNRALAGLGRSLRDAMVPHARADLLIQACARQRTPGTYLAHGVRLIKKAISLPEPQKVRALRGMIPAIRSNQQWVGADLVAILEPLRDAVQGVATPQARFESMQAMSDYFRDLRFQHGAMHPVQGSVDPAARVFFQAFAYDCQALMEVHVATLVPLQPMQALQPQASLSALRPPPAPVGAEIARVLASAAVVRRVAVQAEIGGMLASGLYLLDNAQQRTDAWHSLFAHPAYGVGDTRHAVLDGLAVSARHLVGRPVRAAAIQKLVGAVPTLAGAHQAALTAHLAGMQRQNGNRFAGLYDQLRALIVTLDAVDRSVALESVINIMQLEPAEGWPARFADLLTQVDAAPLAHQAHLLIGLCGRLTAIAGQGELLDAFDAILTRTRALEPAQRAELASDLINKLHRIDAVNAHKCMKVCCASRVR